MEKTETYYAKLVLENKFHCLSRFGSSSSMEKSGIEFSEQLLRVSEAFFSFFFNIVASVLKSCIK